MIICNKKLYVKKIVDIVNWSYFIMEIIDVIILV